MNMPRIMLVHPGASVATHDVYVGYRDALRRLGKECYLLNYNGEPHGLRKKANQRDYTLRMQQFFDHHLKGAPMPAWMAKGVPFADREKEKEQWKGLFQAEKK